MSLGVNVPDVEKVIQWGVDEKIDLKMLVQRIGRAARDKDCQGVAVIYASKNIILPDPKDPMQQWVVESSSLSIGLSNNIDAGGDEWEDEEEDRNISDFSSRNISRFSLPVTPETQQSVDRLRDFMYKKASGFKKLRQEAADERNPRKVK